MNAGRRLQREVAADWLTRYPAMLDRLDIEVAEARAREDREMVNRWLDFRSDADYLAELATEILATAD